MKLFLSLIVILGLVACEREPGEPLPQRAYIWQRQWTPQVAAAAEQGGEKLEGFVVFGAEVTWTQGQPKVAETAIDWAALRKVGEPVGLALRIAPYPGPFDDSAIVGRLAGAAGSLVERAARERVPCQEIQVDFDCAQKKLEGYAQWLPHLRQAVKPQRLVITTLPSWLDEPAFPKLLDQADGYVLQVHPIMPQKATARTLICDPELARAWVEKASALKRPFTVALSTYSALAGYDAEGKLLGLALDGVQPAWPGGTQVVRFRTDAGQMAELVRQWQGDQPPFLQEIIWYRLPVSTDQRNWRWPTFAAVVEGKEPLSHLSVEQEGENPRDLALVNEGDGEDFLDGIRVVCTWQGPQPVAFEALPGWEVAREGGALVFRMSHPPTEPLPPRARRGIGWVRFDQPTPLHVQVVR